MSYRIGVISDTHGLLREEVKQALQGCDYILHAGDIDHPSIIDELYQIAPTLFVRGNNDFWINHLAETVETDDFGIRILMIHNQAEITQDITDYDLVIFGHSHQYEKKQVGNTVMLNPGSCGPRRFRLPVTMAMLYIEDDGNFHIERIDLEEAPKKVQSTDTTASIKKHLSSIIKAINKGKSIEQIAKKFHISYELSEKIVRLYVTHPGVDEEGILKKMGI